MSELRPDPPTRPGPPAQAIPFARPGPAARPGPSTLAVHAVPGGDHGAIHPSIQHSATFRYPELPDGSASPYIYSRYTGPTIEGVEQGLARLEGTPAATLFPSGLAAVAAVVRATVPAGGTIVVQRGVYGGTMALLREEFAPLGIRLHVAEAAAPPALPEGTGLVWMESITNPLLRVADVRAWAEAAHRKGARLAVDATFATPLQQRPLELGADVVVHSATKYLGGHSDLLAGVAATRDEPGKGLHADLWRVRRNLGWSTAPDVAFRLGVHVKTLAVRLAAQCRNAYALALAVQGHPAVRHVHHPGLDMHPDHAVVPHVLRPGSDTKGAYGGMVTLDLGSWDAAVRFRRSVQVVVPAASLGGVESLVSLPCETSHAYASPEARQREGIGDGLVRISCGIEDTEDLVADVTDALGSA